MITDLTPGDRFNLGPQYLEFIKMLGDRIGVAYILTPNWERQPDPDDLTGDEYLQVCFSDTRYNDQYEDSLL